jgi:sec-independent protein translocase protein TatC
VTDLAARPSHAGEPDDGGRMPLVEHLRELRRRLTRAVLAILVGTVVAFVFYEELFRLVAAPFDVIKAEYAAEKGATVTLNFQGVADPFSYAVKICVFAGLVGSSPVWLYQLWAFIVPGLHRHERRWAIGFIAASVPLFLAGTYLAYVFLPKGFELLVGFNPAPDQVANIIGFDKYLSFVIRTMLVFGLSFVMPVLLVALNLVGVVSAAALARSWRPVVLGAFVFAAVATPSGDPVTMLALATPMLILFWIAVGVCALVDRRRRRQGVDGVDYSELDDDVASPLDPTPYDDDPDDGLYDDARYDDGPYDDARYDDGPYDDAGRYDEAHAQQRRATTHDDVT